MQIMKEEYLQLSHEAHECADSIPDLNKMVFAVQELGMLNNRFNLILGLSFEYVRFNLFCGFQYL